MRRRSGTTKDRILGAAGKLNQNNLLACILPLATIPDMPAL